MSTTTIERIETDFNANLMRLQKRWQADPIYFFTEVLDVNREHIWPKMVEICHSVRDNRKTHVPAGHSVSKTYTAGRLALWFLYSFPPSTVVTTAPTQKQVEEQLWREIRQAHTTAKIPLGGKLTTKKLDLQEETGLRWYALGFATRPDTVTMEATAFQGYHNEHIFLIFDEGAAVVSQIWKAAKHILTSGFWRWLVIGNPTASIGDFANCFDDPYWNTINISVKDTPNFKEGRQIIPGIAGREYEEEMRRVYGEDHREYKIRVLGQRCDYAIDGSYYGPILNEMKNKGRFKPDLYDPSSPVYTCLDIGYTTAIWFWQMVETHPRFIRYYEDTGPGIDFYCELFGKFRQKYGYKYGRHFAPFDIKSNAHRQTIGKTVKDVASEYGVYFEILKAEKDIIDGINNAQKILPNCYFDVNDCSVGVDCLLAYKEKQNVRMSKDDKPYFVGVPQHDWTSHGADSFRYTCRAIKKLSAGSKDLTEEKIRELQRKYGYI